MKVFVVNSVLVILLCFVSGAATLNCLECEDGKCQATTCSNSHGFPRCVNITYEDKEKPSKIGCYDVAACDVCLSKHLAKCKIICCETEMCNDNRPKSPPRRGDIHQSPSNGSIQLYWSHKTFSQKTLIWVIAIILILFA